MVLFTYRNLVLQPLACSHYYSLLPETWLSNIQAALTTSIRCTGMYRLFIFSRHSVARYSSSCLGPSTRRVLTPTRRVLTPDT